MQPETPVHSIECGCGWKAHSDNSDVIRDLMSEHDCPNEVPTPVRWWQGIFSFWGLLIVAVIAATVVQIVTGEQLF